MGAWGAGSFDNDTACDWSYGLEDVDDLSLVRETLAEVLDGAGDYLDADVASEALGACEVIARLNGNWGPRNPHTEAVDHWVEAHPMPVPADLVQTAIAVIDRVLSADSELLDLWNESDSGDDWRKAVEELRQRVAA